MQEVELTEDITNAVIQAVTESLMIKPGKATLESKLFIELNASSIDLIDILSRLERKFSISLLTPTDYQPIADFRADDIRLRHLAWHVVQKIKEK